jgi:hypothetical protein
MSLAHTTDSVNSEEVLAAEMDASVQASSTQMSTEIDLSNPISLKKITKAARKNLERKSF